jgi:hypothetical protein
VQGKDEEESFSLDAKLNDHKLRLVTAGAHGQERRTEGTDLPSHLAPPSCWPSLHFTRPFEVHRT